MLVLQNNFIQKKKERERLEHEQKIKIQKLQTDLAKHTEATEKIHWWVSWICYLLYITLALVILFSLFLWGILKFVLYSSNPEAQPLLFFWERDNNDELEDITKSQTKKEVKSNTKKNHSVIKTKKKKGKKK